MERSEEKTNLWKRIAERRGSRFLETRRKRARSTFCVGGTVRCWFGLNKAKDSKFERESSMLSRVRDIEYYPLPVEKRATQG